MTPDDPSDAAAAAWVPVARAADLGDGDIVPVEVAGRSVIVFRDGDRVGCLQRKCVHQGGDLAGGVIMRQHLICPQHGWKFSTLTGAHPESPETCLARFDVRITADGVIEVDPTPRRAPPARNPTR